MDNELKQKIKEGEKERKKYLLMIRLGEMLKSFGRRFIGYDQGEWKVFAIIVRVILIAVLFGIGLDIIPVLIIYAALHIGIYVGGNILSTNFVGKIRVFETEWLNIYNDYFFDRALSDNIIIGVGEPFVDYKDGVKIDDRGMVHAEVKEAMGDIYLYVLSNFGDERAFSNLKANPGDHTVVLNKNIASVEFNQKYGAVTDTQNEVQSVKYLSPSRVVKIIKTPELDNFYSIHMRGNTFRARTDNHVDRPEVLNVYENKHLKKYFEEADKYCVDLKAMADKIYKDYMKVAYLLDK